jgi:hypothetical protein
VRDISWKKQLFIGCDANAHHLLWGSTATNPREESSVEFLLSSNLNIFNHGIEPTFEVCNRTEVIDMTLGTNKIANLVSNWHVSDEQSLSDHRYVCFQICNIKINQVTFRDPRKTNWESYKDNLKENLETISRRIRTIRDIGLLTSYPIIKNVQPRPLALKGWHLGGIKSWVG